MFEEKTAAVIHKVILDEVDNRYDKSAGSFVFDVTQPPAKQFQEVYQDLNTVAGLTDVENLFDEELNKFVNQRTSQTRRPATHAIGTLQVQGNGTVNKGDLFQTSSGIQFESVEVRNITEIATVQVRAVLPGSSGNVLKEQINEMPVSLQGINKINNPEPTTNGYDQENDEELRKRYLERIQTPATSGNIYHYRNWAKEVPSVGDVKIISLWNGDNTVKVIVIDSDMKPASELTVDNVQNYIDPGGLGLGEGQAPIGAFCTVVSAIEKTINITFNAILESGYDVGMVKPAIEDNLTKYLKTVAFKRNFISYAQIGGLILESEGVADYTELIINQGAENIIIANDEVATLGGVNIGT